MKAMLYKEFRLALHPTNLLFLLLGAMLLIPAYPYYVAFMYTCLSIFFLFLSARENQDTRFTALLPVKKRDVVKGRCVTVAAVELMQLLVGVPFAFLTARVNPNPAGNPVGIEANADKIGGTVAGVVTAGVAAHAAITAVKRVASKKPEQVG